MKHLAVVSINVYSHHRSLFSLVASLLCHNKQLFVTHFIPAELKERTDKMLAQFPLAGQEKRLRLIYIDTSNLGPQRLPFHAAPGYLLEHYYEPLMAGRPLEQHDAIGKVDGWLCDLFAHHVIDRLGTDGFKGARMLWVPCDPVSMLSSDLTLIHALGADADKMDALLEAPGVTPRYAYELDCASTHISSAHGVIGDMFKEMIESRTKGDYRQVYSFSPALCPDTGDTLSRHYKNAQVTVITAQYSPSFWTTPKSYPTNDPLFDWLNMRSSQSVILVSFGSTFWPNFHLWQTRTLVDALIASPFRFLLLTGTLLANLMPPGEMEKVQAKVKESGNITHGWCDQHLVMSHPSIAAVIHQGGNGGTFESIRYALPAIVWPFLADQGPNADLVANKLDVAWELWQHRDRLDGKPIASKPGFKVDCTPKALRKELDTVFAELAGEEGKRKRANAQKASAVLLEEHEKQGGKQLDELLSFL